MELPLVELGVATASSYAVSTAVNAEPLLTALITLGISVVTVAGSELVKLIVAWLKAKRQKIENQTNDNKEEKTDGKQ